jgi:hypothetical protein
MNEEKNKDDKNTKQTEESRTMGQEKPGATMEQRKQHKNVDDTPKRPADQTPEEQFYNDQNADPLLAKKQ